MRGVVICILLIIAIVLVGSCNGNLDDSEYWAQRDQEMIQLKESGSWVMW